MSISTYAELQTAIGNWLHRDNLTSHIPDFITIAEARIGREIKSRLQQQRVTTAVDTYINVPSDFISMRALFMTSAGRIYKLQYLTPDALFAMYPHTTTGTPKHFTIFGDEIRFGPIPTSANTVELWYYKRLAALSGAVNTLFTTHPDLYLYASLCAATPFIKNDPRIPMWEAQYLAVKTQINISEEDGIRTSDMQMVAA